MVFVHVLGQVHQRISTQLEGVDNMAEDPCSVKGLMSYFLEWNTWSIDGLPGVKVNAEKVSKEQISSVMVRQGLGPNLRARPNWLWRARKIAPVDQSTLMTLLLGIFLGALLATYGREAVVRARTTLLHEARFVD